MKMIDGYLKYEASTNGNNARAAFAAILATEIAKDVVLIEVPYNDGSLKINDTDKKEITFRIFYPAHNAGIAEWNSFWTTCQTEKNTALVLTTSYIQKCDNLHDVGLPCCNWVEEAK